MSSSPDNQITLRSNGASFSYVLMTAAYNEEAHIEKTLKSVVSQTVRPLRWVVVSDSSDDRTDEIVQAYAEKHDFIRFLRVTKTPGRDFQSKIVALRKGVHLLDGVAYDFIGNVDADLSLEPKYFEDLLSHFERNPRLGLTGGFVYEDHGSGFKSCWFNSVNDVGHAAQLVRRECYEQIGGYQVLKYGGEDWLAQTCAKMHGWNVQSVPELKILHYRPVGTGSRSFRNSYRQGKMDYALGSDPMFEVIKCLRRFREKPFLLSSFIRLFGFVSHGLSSEPRAVPEDAAAFLRREQRQRVTGLFSRLSLSTDTLPKTRTASTLEGKREQ